MSPGMIGWLGYALSQPLTQLKASVTSTIESTKAEAKREALRLGVTAWLILVATIAACGTVAVGLMALYRWVESQEGPLAAYGVVGGATGLITLLLLCIVWARSQPEKTEVVKAKAEVAAAKIKAEAVAAADAVRPPRPALDLASLIPAAGSSIPEEMIHRVASRVASAGDEAMEAAEDAVRNGSREALVGTLVLTMLIGVLVGRKTGQSQS